MLSFSNLYTHSLSVSFTHTCFLSFTYSHTFSVLLQTLSSHTGTFILSIFPSFCLSLAQFISLKETFLSLSISHFSRHVRSERFRSSFSLVKTVFVFHLINIQMITELEEEHGKLLAEQDDLSRQLVSTDDNVVVDDDENKFREATKVLKMKQVSILQSFLSSSTVIKYPCSSQVVLVSFIPSDKAARVG